MTSRQPIYASTQQHHDVEQSQHHLAQGGVVVGQGAPQQREWVISGPWLVACRGVA